MIIDSPVYTLACVYDGNSGHVTKILKTLSLTKKCLTLNLDCSLSLGRLI